MRIKFSSEECNWASQPVDASKVLIARWKAAAKALPEGVPIIDRTKAERDQDVVGQRGREYDKRDEDILIPIDNEVTWEHNFYHMLWEKNMRNDLFLVLQVLESTSGINEKLRPTQYEYHPVAYGCVKVNNRDGTIRYGTFDVTMYQPPARIRNHDIDKRMKATIKVTISQPLP